MGARGLCIATLLGMVFLAGASQGDKGLAEEAPPTAADSINHFGLDAYGALRSREGSLAFSPFSAYAALTVAHAGAQGETARQIAEVLHVDESSEDAPALFRAVADRLVPSGPKEAFGLRVANGLWVQEGHPIRPVFLHVARYRHRAQVESCDFAGDPGGACRQINRWAEKQTRGRITDIVAEETLATNMSFVLANAVYFRGLWLKQFKEPTTEASFWVEPDRTVQVRMMKQHELFSYAEVDECKILAMAYKDLGAQMIVLLPKERGGLADLEARLDVASLNTWCSLLETRSVDLSLPRFRAESGLELGRVLCSLGMDDAFEPSRADFSGIITDCPLWVGRVAQKTFVAVDEKGTEAAAVTHVEVVYASAPPAVFRADHPFMFFIQDLRTGVILFMGRVVSPSQ